MDSLLLWTIGTGTLLVVCFLAMVLTVVFRKKMDVEAAHFFFGLMPLEFMILFFGVPFFLCLCFFLSWSFY